MSDLPGASALQAALSGEHAAIFGYGVVGARTSGNDRSMVMDCQAAHQKRRDALTARLTAAGVDAPAASAAYGLPFPVTSAADARKLAVTIEERIAALWRAAVAPTSGDDRRTAVDALTDAAVRATTWRQRAGSPPTVPFPGS
ncbi:ferritin-like domain-containing protein [Fodinicola acaciae]|uniref:ferritin-like domain-containing protein n=1 Tax=Fodinicola acaciae TaxID=2681555 RepID=UPI0013D85A5B|nr:ferritin-like domain-containing protein [Fodinicola acaciae]